MPKKTILLSTDEIEYLLDILNIQKSKYKTQEEWWNSKEFELIETLSDAVF